MGCSADGGDGDGDPNHPVDASVVVTPDAGPTWAFDDVLGVPNFDDDDGSIVDWNQPPFASDDDFTKMTLPANILALVPSGGTIEMSLAGDTTKVRVFKGDQQVYQHVLGAEKAAATYSFTPGSGDEEFFVEFGAYMAKAQLTLTSRDGSGAMIETTTSTLRASPLIMNHHLQPAERVWMVSLNGNESMAQAFQAALGSKFTLIAGHSVDWDVWVQDEFEFATLIGANDQRIDVVIDSIRNRGLQNYSSTFRRPNSYTQTWGNPNFATTYDAFGNLEASPPVTVGGIHYPFGRIYYGRTANEGMSTTLGNFLTSQKVQAPFQIPTNWLCVGHVDEFSTFVPAPGTAKGFKLVMADTTSAYALLQSLNPAATLPLYGADHGYSTVGSILNDNSLRTVNNRVQSDYLDPITETFKTQLGLTDDDIIKVPSLFEVVSQCGGGVAALIPGMTNLTVASDGTTTHVFIADPFFRSVVSQATDPVINAFKSLMPPGLTLHFVDDWDVYHMGLGEVHCGTNVKRTPTAKWWDTASHLMGGN